MKNYLIVTAEPHACKLKLQQIVIFTYILDIKTKVLYTVFTRFVPHPCTIRRVLSLFLKIVLIVLHPQIVPHHIFVNTYY